MRKMALSVLMVILLSHDLLRADDVFYYIPLDKLELTSGALPNHSDVQLAELRKNRAKRSRSLDLIYPSALGNAGEEMYVVNDVADKGALYAWGQLRPSLNYFYLAVRTSSGQIPSGRLFVPKADWSGMIRLEFKIVSEPTDPATAQSIFYQAKARYYQRLLNLNIAGAAWFRHQMLEAQSRYKITDKTTPNTESNLSLNRFRQRSDIATDDMSQLDRTYALFTGGRALSENLQLDRQIESTDEQPQTIPVSSIEGVSAAEIDWRPIIQDMHPEKDALAKYIPADQHVLFFPSFQAMIALMDEAEAHGVPVLQLLEPRSESALRRQKYERQLCLSLDEIIRRFGGKAIKSVAFSGSDPYLRTGSDVALLFEAIDVPLLKTAVTARYAAAASMNSMVTSNASEYNNVPYNCVTTPDRSVCSYLAVIDQMVLVTNSEYQLQRIIQTAQGIIPNLASLDEYTFFRDRYKINDPQETALLILTDAAIRRWCGPQWRIAASRRTRMAGCLAELQAQHLDGLVRESIPSGPLTLEKPILDAGEIYISPAGVRSSIYGTLEFLTPIAELPLDKVSSEEKLAYQRFRDMYQHRWRRYFDPIAIRFSVNPDAIGLDLTVRPLIAGSDYHDYIELTSNAAITPRAGDPHADTLLHFLMSLNPKAPPIQSLNRFALRLAPDVNINLTDWLGEWITIYVDEDSFWDELAQAVNTEGTNAAYPFMKDNLSRLPMVLHIDVDNPFKLSAFLVSLRAFVEQTAPNLTLWTPLKYNEQSYVKISNAATENQANNAWANYAIYYTALPDALIISLDESMLKKILDRKKPTMEATADNSPASPPSEEWLGQSMALNIKKNALILIQSIFQENLKARLEQRSWANLPILNEWRRRYPNTNALELHQRFWQTQLICPGGGKYIWNDEFQTFESTVFGHPGQPRSMNQILNSWFDITDIKLGVSFEENGVRTRAELQRKTD